ncbi:hypothetical protein [Desulfosarcina cetonica]|uniref:hypothetical protein n=1 Tax=Desulfosarcina cetonica TaxID=90730 RepID=UPI00278BC189|nr:hypothetical protein [Desulfosarcina cetonica]
MAIRPQTEVPDGGTDFPVKVPILAVLGTVKIKKIFKHLGGADQFGIELLGKDMVRCVALGNVDATLDVIQ